MSFLALETATSVVGVAVADGGRPLVSATLDVGARHAELLAPAIDFCRRCAGLELRDLDGIAVDRGPGLFTGLRVGLATAKALGAALSVPVVGITSLEVLAVEALQSMCDGCCVAAALDARRGEVYWAAYRGAADAVAAVTAPRVGDPRTMVADLEALAGSLGTTLCVVGDGAARHAPLLALSDQLVRVERPERPSVAALCRLAAAAFARGDGGEAMGLEPLYLRAPDARVGWAPGVVAAGTGSAS